MSQPAEADANATPDNLTEAPIPTKESLSKEDVLKAEMKALKIVNSPTCPAIQILAD
jgi:hypothetical protein